MTDYQLNFRPYRRPFKYPLITSHGKWEVREGIILRLTDEIGGVGWGEIAPISWFGSETLAQAWEFCSSLPPKITATEIFSIPDQLPACQFGFESAWEMADGEDTCSTPMALSYLLPHGETALHSWQTAWHQGYRTFKWKIGVAAIEDEIKVFHQLMQILPTSVKLRLDANGGLGEIEAHQWLQVSDRVGKVEFLEQPLSHRQFDPMLEMSNYYATPIALDESVATLDQLEACYQRGWRGIFVIKAAIAGSPKRLRQLSQNYQLDMVFSSVFESAIAKKAALQLAAELSHPNRAVGFGINHWFVEEDETWLKRLWNSP